MNQSKKLLSTYSMMERDNVRRKCLPFMHFLNVPQSFLRLPQLGAARSALGTADAEARSPSHM